MSARTHFPVLHCYCMLFAAIRYVSKTTRYPPLSSCAISNLHAVMAASLPLCRLRHVLLGLGNLVSIHSSKWRRKWVRRCRNHLYVGSPEVPGLRLVRNILRRRMRGILSGPRRSRHSSRRGTDYSRASRRRRGLRNLRVSFSGRRERRKLRNWWVKLSY
jgi:hypothetical protein